MGLFFSPVCLYNIKESLEFFFKFVILRIVSLIHRKLKLFIYFASYSKITYACLLCKINQIKQLDECEIHIRIKYQL